MIKPSVNFAVEKYQLNEVILMKYTTAIVSIALSLGTLSLLPKSALAADIYSQYNSIDNSSVIVAQQRREQDRNDRGHRDYTDYRDQRDQRDHRGHRDHKSDRSHVVL